MTIDQQTRRQLSADNRERLIQLENEAEHLFAMRTRLKEIRETRDRRNQSTAVFTDAAVIVILCHDAIQTEIQAILDTIPLVVDLNTDGSYTPTNPLFKALTADEVAEFRQWATDNHRAGDAINSVWHPVIQDACRKINTEVSA